MEADSEKKKRGRPNVYAKYDLEDIRQELLKDKGERATQNELYIMDAIEAVERLNPFGCEWLYFIPENMLAMSSQEAKKAGYKRDSTVLEQLGRALTQDRFTDEDFIFLAEKAADYKCEGYNSKEIAQWIREVRLKAREKKG